HPSRPIYLIYIHSHYTTLRHLHSFPTRRSSDLYMMRLPKCLWVYMPDVGRSELLTGHLARRNQITNDLGISASTDMSIEAYQACVLQRHAERRAAIQKKNIFFGIAVQLAFRFFRLLRSLFSTAG